MSKHRLKGKPSSTPHHQAAAMPKTRPYLFIVGGLILIALAGGAFLLNQPPDSDAPLSSTPAEISVAEAAEKYEAGAFFLDVRTPEEWNEIHIPNSILIPLNELENRIDELPRGVEIVVVCRSGNRSQQGREILTQAGFAPVSSMAGGIREWSTLGYPTTSGE